MTVDFDFARPAAEQLLVTEGGNRSNVEVSASDGWFEEIRYFVECVSSGTGPSIVTMDDALTALKVIGAERASVQSGKPVEIR